MESAGQLSDAATKIDNIISRFPCSSIADDPPTHGGAKLPSSYHTKGHPACFSTVGSKSTHHHHGNHHHGHHSHGHHNHNHHNQAHQHRNIASLTVGGSIPSSSWIRVNKVISDKSPGLRKVQSTLNKVSDKNYDKIFGLVFDCMVPAGDVSVQDLVDAILDQCVRQACYVQLFARMLYDIDSFFVKNDLHDDSNVVRSSIAAFCDAFFEFDESLANVTSIEAKGGDAKVSDEDDYNTYCQQVKIKTKLIGRCKLVLHVIKLGLYSRYQISDVMTMIIKHACKIAAQSSDCGHLDMLLDFATEYKTLASLDVQNVPWIPEWIPDLSMYILPHVHNSRQRFKLIDIVDEASSKCAAQTCHLA